MLYSFVRIFWEINLIICCVLITVYRLLKWIFHLVQISKYHCTRNFHLMVVIALFFGIVTSTFINWHHLKISLIISYSICRAFNNVNLNLLLTKILLFVAFIWSFNENLCTSLVLFSLVRKYYPKDVTLK